MCPPVLQNLIDLGEQMHEAMLREDLDALLQVLAERSEVIGSLSEALTLPPSQRERIASQLLRQQQRLEEALIGQENRLSKALRRLTFHKTARQSYGRRPPPRRLLNKNLRG